MTKTCTKCHEPKPLDQFSSDTTKPGGLYPSCRTCCAAQHRTYYARNREKVLAQMRRHDRENPEKEKAYRRKRRVQRRDNLRQWRASNLDHARAYARAYQRTRMADPQYKMKKTLRGRLTSALRNRGVPKAAKTEALLGCSYAKFVTHIESLFRPGMTWANHGMWRVGQPMTWHVDHIKPCSSFDLTDPEQQRICFHYTNLQPLWAIDNLLKDNPNVKSQ